MNRRSVYESSPVQQMMAAGNPNWWFNINSMRPPSQATSFPFLPPNNSPNTFFPHFAPTSSSSSSSNSSSPLPMPSWQDHNQDYTYESLSQLLLSGLVGEEEKAGVMSHFQVKKLENWEEQVMLSQAPNVSAVDIKQEVHSAANSYLYGHGHDHHHHHQFQAITKPDVNWSQIMASNSSSSPNNSCVTTTTTTSLSTDILDFSNKITKPHHHVKHPPPDHQSYECNSTATCGAVKKARVQPSSTQTTFKVRKEKLGDRITALHQLVSPFGKTDTASVLLESIGYIRFLQSQIEVLSLPYLGSGSGNMRQQQSVHGDRNCMFPEHPGQLLNDNCLKRKGASEQDSREESKDLKSRGLCLVPVSCTLQVGSDNGADYWAPALGGGNFR